MAAIEAGTSSLDMHTELPEELDTLEEDITQSLVYRVKMLMMGMLKDYGFAGILFLASVPNLAFDLCGICCGHFLMPFGVFFGATFIGKAVIRNGYQSLVYITICDDAHLQRLILFLQRLLPDRFGWDAHVREVLEGGKKALQGSTTHSAGASSGTTAQLRAAWAGVMAMLLCGFLVNFVASLAQMHQMRADQVLSKQLRRRMNPSVKAQIMSPKSGRLILPPPTPKRARSDAAGTGAGTGTGTGTESKTARKAGSKNNIIDAKAGGGSVSEETETETAVDADDGTVARIVDTSLLIESPPRRSSSAGTRGLRSRPRPAD